MMIHLMSKQLHVADQFKSFSKIPNEEFWENSELMRNGYFCTPRHWIYSDTNIYPMHQGTPVP